jgi:hypothetical protein
MVLAITNKPCVGVIASLTEGFTLKWFDFIRERGVRLRLLDCGRGSKQKNNWQVIHVGVERVSLVTFVIYEMTNSISPLEDNVIYTCWAAFTAHCDTAAVL